MAHQAERIFSDGRDDWQEKKIACTRHLPANNDHVRIEYIDQASYVESQLLSDLFYQFNGK